VEHNPYYDGLSDAELAQNGWLIVAAELLWYCESRHADYVRYNQLKSSCNIVLNSVTDGDRSNFGGSFDSVINSSRYEKFWYVDRTIKNETRILPNIPAIQNEIRGRKIEILNRRNNRVIRIINKVDIVEHRREVVEPPVSVSDRVERVVTRGPNTLLLLIIQSSPCALPGP
jgi:hypothetical protein